MADYPEPTTAVGPVVPVEYYNTSAPYQVKTTSPDGSIQPTGWMVPANVIPYDSALYEPEANQLLTTEELAAVSGPSESPAAEPTKPTKPTKMAFKRQKKVAAKAATTSSKMQAQDKDAEPVNHEQDENVTVDEAVEQLAPAALQPAKPNHKKAYFNLRDNSWEVCFQGKEGKRIPKDVLAEAKDDLRELLEDPEVPQVDQDHTWLLAYFGVEENDVGRNKANFFTGKNVKTYLDYYRREDYNPPKWEKFGSGNVVRVYVLLPLPSHQ